MTRIFLLGDTHADADFMKRMGVKANEFDCDLIMQLGDFGWWPRMKDGFFRRAVEMLDIPVYFIPGNHEDWESLVALEFHDWYENDKTFHTGFINCSPNLYYCPTGLSWEWDGVKFLSAGGAYSIDKFVRTDRWDWFQEEMINDKQVDFCAEAGKIDVLVSHDAPSCVDMALEFTRIGRRYTAIGETEYNRSQLQRIVDAAQPTRIYHGHWHMDYVQLIGDLRVQGLHCNFNAKTSWTIFDTKDFHEREQRRIEELND